MVDTISSRTGRTAPIADVIITRLSVVAVCLRIMVVVAMLFACWYSVLHPTKDVTENGIWWLFALFFTPTLLWSEWLTIRQIIFRGTRAVWIEDGRLKFIDDTTLNPRFRFPSLEIADIEELSVDREYLIRIPRGLPCVRVRMKDGRYGGTMLTLYFTDSAPVVRARLAEALGLERSPAAAKTL